MPPEILDELRERLRRFASERDWEKFHSPKNLACALSVEAAELLEIFQWEPSEAKLTLDSAQKARVGDELADILFYLVMIADKLDIELPTAISIKLSANESKYPVALSRGRSTKYTEFES